MASRNPKEPKPDEAYSDEEVARRRDEALRRALNTPPKRHQEREKKRRTDNAPARPKRKLPS